MATIIKAVEDAIAARIAEGTESFNRSKIAKSIYGMVKATQGEDAAEAFRQMCYDLYIENPAITEAEVAAFLINEVYC